jgi:hypothetical protein
VVKLSVPTVEHQQIASYKARILAFLVMTSDVGGY